MSHDDSSSPIKGWRPILPSTTPEPQPVSTLTPPLSLPTPPPKGSVPLSSMPGSMANEPPRYQRTPRKYVTFPQNEVEVQAPSPAPSAPNTTIASLMLPLSGTVLSVVISVVLVVTATKTNGMSLIGLVMSVPMMLASLGSGLYNFKRERKKYEQETTSREQNYRAYLADRRQALDAMRQAQLNASLVPNPDLTECHRRAERRDPEKRLWERAPGDGDFLSLRLGTGQTGASFPVKPPALPQGGGAPDNLLQDALNLAKSYGQIDGVAIPVPLLQIGSVSFAGRRDVLHNIMRALLMQLATHHAPTEVKVVLIFPENDIDAWAWVRWLPHVWDDDRSQRFMASTPDAARQLLSGLYDLLKQRELQRADDKGSSQVIFSPSFVFIFADPTLFSGPEAANLGPLLRLLANGTKIGAHALYLHERLEQARKECGAVVDLTGNNGKLRVVGPPSIEYIFTPDRVDSNQALAFSVSLAPLRLETLGGASNLPVVVPLLDLFGVTKVEDLPVRQNWQKSEPFKSLSVPLGRRAGNDLVYLDLHERGHGPNGLVAGTVGSGKSELIQSLILSLAIHFPPSDVVFVLLDFKGGGMAFPMEGLPHVVNIITNLEMELVGRALTSLEAELERREHLFKQAGVTHIDDYMKLYRQKKVKDSLPYLVLIVDEFTVLKDKQPDDMRRFVMVAVKGRSLGFRMILATQKPHGVISDQIDANSRFRLCLRVARPEDSTDMIKRPDAASLTGAGRTYFRVGEDEIFELFQTAWSGAPYIPDGGGAKQDPQGIAEVFLNGGRRLLQPTTQAAKTQSSGKQMEVVIQHLQRLAEQGGMKDLPKVWLAPLPLEIPLGQIRPAEGWNGKTWQPSKTWLAPVIGLVDDPVHQRQDPLRLDLGRQGHLAIYGAPGVGKTTFLQTLVMSLVFSHSPQEVNLYLLDFGGRILKLFEALPHVGGVILPDETERLKRLVKLLQREMDERKTLLVQAGVSTLTAYRGQVSDPPPAIVVLVDNYPELALNDPELADAFTAFTREGANLGIHFIFTSNMINAIPSRVSGNMALAVALEMNDQGDYGQVVGRTGALLPLRGVRGRGLVRGAPPLEFQTALPVAGATESERSTAMARLFGVMSAAWQGPCARPVPVLPAVVPLCDLQPPTNVWSSTAKPAVPIGLDTETLEPFELGLSDGPHFLITGHSASGKTSLLQSWVLALAEQVSPEWLELYLLDLGNSNLMPFSHFPHVKAYVEDDDRLGEMLDVLRLKLDERRQKLDKARREAGGLLDEDAFISKLPSMVLVMDDYDQFCQQASDGHKTLLEELLRRRGLGFHTLIAGPISEFSTTWESLGKTIKAAQTGFLLGTTDPTDLSLFNFRLPMGVSGKTLPPGMGYYVRRGKYRSLKCVTAREGTLTLVDWARQIQQKSTV